MISRGFFYDFLFRFRAVKLHCETECNQFVGINIAIYSIVEELGKKRHFSGGGYISARENSILADEVFKQKFLL